MKPNSNADSVAPVGTEAIARWTAATISPTQVRRRGVVMSSHGGGGGSDGGGAIIIP
jgi:hypothetical protein